LTRLRGAELPEEIPLKKAPPTENDYKKAFGIIGRGESATREITKKNKKKETQEVSSEIVKEWFQKNGETKLTPQDSLTA